MWGDVEDFVLDTIDLRSVVLEKRCENHGVVSLGDSVNLI